MTKTKGTKKALLLSVVSLFACFAMLLGTTFAWFTDSVISANNIITSGTLDIEMYWADGTEDPNNATWADASTGAIFNYDNWEPGYVEVRHIKIANEGTLALKYKVQIIANGEVSDLADVIDVYYLDPAAQIADRTALTEANKIGTLTEVLAGLDISGNGTLLKGESDVITIALKMQESAGNEYQNLSIGSSFSIQLLATQYTAENDSFGDQYDAEAEYPEILFGAVVKRAGVAASVSADKFTVEIPAEADEGSYTLEIKYKNVEISESNRVAIDVDIDLKKDNAQPAAGTEYTVSAYIGEARTDIALAHNGVSIDDFDYSSDTGILSFKTTSFSPFTFAFNSNPEGMLAEAIGSYDIPYYYTSLQPAIDAAKKNGTVKLLGTVYLDETIVINKDITFDMNNKTLRTNATIGTDPLVNVLADVVILNGKIKGDDNGTRYGFVVGNETVAGKLTISDGRYQTSGSAVYVVNGSADISGGQFIIWPAANTLKSVDCLDSAYEAGKANIRVTGGQFTYTGSPEKYVPEGYAASVYLTYTGGIYEYIVGKAIVSTELEDGTVKYDAALASAIQYTIPEGSSGKVTILEDQVINGNKLYNGSPVNAYNKNVVLDLNGKTITFDYSQQTDANATASSATWTSIYVAKGTLTIIDSGENGTIYNKEHSASDTTNRRYNRIIWAGTNSNVVIEDGKFINELRDAMFYSTSNGCFELNGGYFEQINKQESGAGAVGYVFFNNNNTYPGSIVISGGTFKTHPLAGWYGDNTAEATIAEGHIINANSDGTFAVVQE